MDWCEIQVTEWKGGLVYRLSRSGQRGTSPSGETSRDAVAETRRFLRETYLPTIQDGSKISYLYNGELKTALRGLYGLGREVYTKFVPSQLRDIVHRMRDGSVLHIVSDALWIPWELVYNDTDFWCRRFVISRATTGYNLPLEPIRPKYQKIVNVIGATMSPQVKERALHLFDPIKNKVRVKVIDGDKIRTVEDDVYPEFRGADLIHMTCHGIAAGKSIYLQIVKSPIASVNFVPSAIASLPIKPGCIVFANACGSSSYRSGIASPLSFGTAFCSSEKRGGAYVGTLDLVPDEPAVAFAQSFYRFLFAGYPVGESLRLAKGTRLTTGVGLVGVFPLVYSLYGNPYVSGASFQ